MPRRADRREGESPDLDLGLGRLSDEAGEGQGAQGAENSRHGVRRSSEERGNKTRGRCRDEMGGSTGRQAATASDSEGKVGTNGREGAAL